MARQDWKVIQRGVELSPTYHNKKRSILIAIGHKQLGSFDNFKVERFPFITQYDGGSANYEKWFSTKPQAMSYLKEYMRKY